MVSCFSAAWFLDFLIFGDYRFRGFLFFCRFLFLTFLGCFENHGFPAQIQGLPVVFLEFVLVFRVPGQPLCLVYSFGFSCQGGGGL